MFERVRLCILKQLYKLLIVNVTIIDKRTLPAYERFRTFSTLKLDSNKGVFTFVFKEDRRSRIRTDSVFKYLMGSYFVELVVPECLKLDAPKVNNQLVIIVIVKPYKVNYKALAHILLDNYIDKIR
jgi:hypothetical protein